jgi:hypothetical protein
MRLRRFGYQRNSVTPCALFFVVIACLVAGHAQAAPQAQSADVSLSDAVQQLQAQVRELQSAVAELRSQTAQSRAENESLRRALQRKGREEADETPATPYASAPAAPATPASSSAAQAAGEKLPPSKDTSARLAKLEEQYQLLTGKVDEQYQTKVESASRYRARLSGIVLLNLFSNVGNVRNLDIPVLAESQAPGSSGGSFGGTVRQSQIGLEIYGPNVAGARTRADVRFDFAGGFENTVNGVNAGLVRLQTATVRMDWPHTSVVGGQDSLFFSPLSPTSLASLAIPALSYAGNLWNWTPQLRVEHRFTVSETSNVMLQGGILDPVTGDPPPDSYYRVPQAGESSRQPAYASRVAWERTLFGQPLTVGIAGYYSHQNYGFGRNVDGWAGMSDWNLPLGRMFSLSGKLYRGRAVGGLGGGVGQSVLFSPAIPGHIQPVDALGGWAQLKFRPAPRLEFNTALGEDNPFASQVRAFPDSSGYFGAAIAKNQSAFGNVILRPRSDILFSAEYRYLRTFAINNRDWTAHQVNLMMGVLF